MLCTGRWAFYHRVGNHVSNPFRAGHCCARLLYCRSTFDYCVFQTPSERGIAVHFARSATRAMGGECFKPLQSGALLCTSVMGRILKRPTMGFQTPSERGIAVHADRAVSAIISSHGVSNPFRAGHCCAPSSTCSTNSNGCTGFKPLQSGALLCTAETSPASTPAQDVSNPFRAGHCCAPPRATPTPGGNKRFQTPSERGIAVHNKGVERPPACGTCFKPLQSGALLCTSED